MTAQDLTRVPKLPNEILSQIFEAAAYREEQSIPGHQEDHHGISWQCEDHNYSNETLTNISLVSNRFHQLARPLRFRTIDTCIDTRGIRDVRFLTPLSQVASPLLRSLQSESAWGQNCRVFKADTWDAWPETGPENDIITSLPNVRCLRMRGHVDDKLLQKFVQVFPALVHLHLVGTFVYKQRFYSAHRPCLRLEHVLREIDFPHLRVLRLDGLCLSEEAFSIPTEKIRKGTFTTLILNNFCDTLEPALQQLLLWPKTLVHFAIDAPYLENQPPEAKRCTASLQTPLEPFKATLRTLHISDLRCSCPAVLDLSDFTALRFLRMTARNRYCRSLIPFLAPGLEVLQYDFWRMTSGRISNDWDWKINHVGRLRGFGEAAVAKNVPLKRIEITFDPTKPTNPNYPWDKLDCLRENLGKVGIDMKCKGASWSE